MADPLLIQLALAAGLLPAWVDVHKRHQQVSQTTLRYLLNALGLPCASRSQIKASLEQLSVAPANTTPTTQAEVAHCLTVAELTGATTACAWGVIAQVYSLYEANSTFPAEYAALAKLARSAAGLGASALALSPVHAMFSADPSRYSPYSPSSRLFLNTAFIDPVQVLGKASLNAALKASGISLPVQDPLKPVDWTTILPARLQVHKQLFRDFQAHASASLVADLAAFRQQGGQALENHACYEALHAFFAPTLGQSCGWRDWPAAFHDPMGPDVSVWAKQHQEDIAFHGFLQWLADQNMHHAQHAALDAGMGIGLIMDLAIGTDPRGSHAWSRQDQILKGVTVGAPPDLFQPLGQNWELTAFSPLALQQTGFQALVDTLQAVLRYAGGVRIDHILGMGRLWLIPDGCSARDGVYLRYPLADMLCVIAAQARKHQALVIGENLGTVPDGFNNMLEHTGILGTSVLWFEREPLINMPDTAPVPPDSHMPLAAFISAENWSAHTAAMASTHDLPTIRGWWQGRDLYWREQQGLVSGVAVAQETLDRSRDKAALWQTLQMDGGTINPPVAVGPCPVEAPLEAVLSFVARTPAPLALFSLEDLLGVIEQPNLPGPVSADNPHPNWRQRLPLPVGELSSSVSMRRSVASIIQAGRS